MLYSGHTDLLSNHADVYAQESWKRTCPGFHLVKPLDITRDVWPQ